MEAMMNIEGVCIQQLYEDNEQYNHNIAPAVNFGDAYIRQAFDDDGKNMRRHYSYCPAIHPNPHEDIHRDARILMQPPCFMKMSSSIMQNEILPTMPSNEIKDTVLNDFLIMDFGNFLCEKYSDDANRNKMVRRKISQAAELLRLIKSKDPFINQLSDIFNPLKYHVTIEAIKELTGFLEGDFIAPNTAIHIGFMLTELAERLFEYSNIHGRKELTVRLDDWKFVHKAKYRYYITKHAMQCLEERRLGALHHSVEDDDRNHEQHVIVGTSSKAGANKITRITWTTAEKKAVRKAFADHIMRGVIPKSSDVYETKAITGELINRSVAMIKSWIQAEIKRVKGPNCNVTQAGSVNTSESSSSKDSNQLLPLRSDERTTDFTALNLGNLHHDKPPKKSLAKMAKTPWTIPEKMAVRKAFCEHILHRTMPKSREVIDIKSKTEALENRSVAMIKSWIQAEIKRMKDDPYSENSEVSSEVDDSHMKSLRIPVVGNDRGLLYNSHSRSIGTSTSMPHRRVRERRLPSVAESQIFEEEDIEGDLSPIKMIDPKITRTSWSSAEITAAQAGFADHIIRGTVPNSREVIQFKEKSRELAGRSVAMIKSWVQAEIKRRKYYCFE